MEAPKTRLIVKNVPKHVDEKRLWQHFAERGEVSFCDFKRYKDTRTTEKAPQSHRQTAVQAGSQQRGGSICWTHWRAQAADLYDAVSECSLLAVGPLFC